MNLDEILGNKELTDDFEIALGDKGSFKLGDLRALHGERDTYRTERDNLSGERDRYRGDYEKLNGTVTQLMAEASKRATQEVETPPPNPQEQLLEAMRKLVAPQDPSNVLFKDDTFGPAFNRIREETRAETEAKYKALEEKFNALNGLVENGFKTVGSAFQSERQNRWYYDNRGDIPTGADGKKLSLEQIHNYAVQNNMIVPNTQLVDYDKALDSLNAPIRQKQEMDKIRKEAYELGVNAGRTGKAQVLPMFGDRSGGGGAVPKPDTKGKSTKQILSEAIGMGLADPDLAGNQ